MPHLGDPRIHLAARKLAALTGFRALRHFDLDVGAVGQVVRRDAEPGRRDLLDGTAAPIAVGVALEAAHGLAALAAVRPATQPVHRDSQRLVRLGGDRAVAHRAGGKAFDDLAGRLDLVEWGGGEKTPPEPPAAASRTHPLAL